MTEIERYLAEEIALDHADGHIPRREALRRLGLLGLGAAAATSLLAACARGEDITVATPPAGPAPSPTAQPTPLPTEAITYPGPDDRTLQGAWAAAAEPRGGVLVIHENRGLTEHIRTVAGRFAATGYSSLAVDLLSEEGGTASLGEEANATATLAKVPPERFVADMQASLTELQKRTEDAKLGAIGFCFGGGMVWRLIAADEGKLAAAAPFYGPLPDGATFEGSKAAVLAVYAELDSRVNATRDAAEAALKEAGLTYELVTYPGADHAFFNDTGQRYNAAAAAEAWTKVQGWFGTHLA